MKKTALVILTSLSLTLMACGSSSDDVIEPADTSAPVITLAGETNIILTVGDTYIEAGATVTDDVDADLTAVIDSTVDTSVAGNYTVTYSVADAAGNAATATRTVKVADAVDTQAPVISLIGAANINLTVGDTYSEAGATVTDNVDANLTAGIEGTVDTSVADTYTLTYSVSDAAGNAVTATRTVVVTAAVVITGDAYIFESSNPDTFGFQYWGDVWDSETQYTDNPAEFTVQPADTTYAKILEFTKSSGWGTLIAWGNDETANLVDISAYTHAKFKVKTDTFTQVEVRVQSPTAVDSTVAYNLSRGTDLGNGWVEMEVLLPGYTQMSWFVLNFIGDSGTVVLLADVYFTTQTEDSVTGPLQAAPVPPQYADDEVIVLYSDSLTEDSFIGVWNANWWNAPVYSEGDITGNKFAKYVITDGGIAGGVVGLEFGFENGPLDASTTTTLNFDLFIESGITKALIQLVSEDGSVTYAIDNPQTDTWVSYEPLFSELTDNDGAGSQVLNSGSLTAVGIQLYGAADKAVYLDNLYFSGQASFFDLSVTVTDDTNTPIANTTVSVGDVSAMTDANGVATLNLQEGEHKVYADAPEYGVALVNKTVLGGDATVDISVVPLNAGPSVAAPIPIISDDDALAIYSDTLILDKFISFWSDPWYNPPGFSESDFSGNKVAKLQITPDGVAGGITGIQYGISNGPLDASTATGIRFDMYATSGITELQIQVVSNGGPGIYNFEPAATGQWIVVDIPFSEMSNSDKISKATLTQLGVGLWGTTSDAVYLDNIYFY
ncbi:immunoglobulin-like domain-containing protein [Paraglaciecola sp. MB-3u-78]|uniref:immunoglobulin-like domain-containing protein n=1 Tax=Paraglaciecola sp. MB-3u-78 TaxID=2058332 RepID=UPI000C34DA48|nr:immunoglobulin-like domain-containing protein [Paraglaciecola sp. MB-3u-78]PKH00261.1 hypothetical protein CXF95_06560 [Paraglaciecola sp. MB-3u-78]